MNLKELVGSIGLFKQNHRDNRLYRRLMAEKDISQRMKGHRRYRELQNLGVFENRSAVVPGHVKAALDAIWTICFEYPDDVRLLINQSLNDCAFNNRICNSIMRSYIALWSQLDDVAESTTILHFMNPNLFIMANDDILKANNKRAVNTDRYVNYLTKMQYELREVITEYGKTNLEEYLSRELGYDWIRPVTKCIHEFSIIGLEGRNKAAGNRGILGANGVVGRQGGRTAARGGT